MRKKLNAVDQLEFDRICEENRKIVASWPKWMQEISITAETASTGNFIKKWRI